MQLLEDRVGGSGPAKRLAVLVVRGRVIGALDELLDAAEGAVARARIALAIFATWDAHEVDELVRLMRGFADAVKDEPLQQSRSVGRS